MQALLAAQPFLRHNQHELGVSLPENREIDPILLFGKTVFRDSFLKIKGTATESSSGRTVYRDASGRIVGTESR